MFDPIKELVVAVVILIATSLWWYFDPSAESRAASVGAVAIAVAAAIHLAYRRGAESMSEQEKNDIYEKQKEIMVSARKRLVSERSNLERLATDPKSSAGNNHGETKPFELLEDDLMQPKYIKEYKKYVYPIVLECRRILTLPSGSRDVSKLMPLLKELDTKLSDRLQENIIFK